MLSETRKTEVAGRLDEAEVVEASCCGVFYSVKTSRP
jgi:hypothetical protein